MKLLTNFLTDQSRTAILVLALSSGALSSTYANAESPPRGTVTIQDFRTSGAGCRLGNVASNLSPDQEALTILFSDFVAELSGRGRAVRQTCKVDINLNVPAGWSFAIFTAVVRGFVSLDQGVEARQSIDIFNGRGAHEREVAFFSGATDQDYVRSISIPVSNNSWSLCNSRNSSQRLSVTIHSFLRDTNRPQRDVTHQGLLTVDSVDGYLTQQYQIAWQRC